MVEFRACQHGQKTNAAVVVFRLFQASFVWRPGWACSWLPEIRGGEKEFKAHSRGKTEKTWSAWLEEATFECYWKKRNALSFRFYHVTPMSVPLQSIYKLLKEANQ